MKRLDLGLMPLSSEGCGNFQPVTPKIVMTEASDPLQRFLGLVSIFFFITLGL